MKLKAKIKEVINGELLEQLNNPNEYIVSSEYISLLINNYNDEYCFYITPFKAFKYQFWYNYKVSFGMKIQAHNEIFSYYLNNPFSKLHKRVSKLMVEKKVSVRSNSYTIAKLPKKLQIKLENE